MVTNLPPEALAQFRKVVASKTPEEKLQNLKIYLSMIPKHKGTAKLVVQIKRQIARLESEITEEKMRKRRQRSSSSTILDINKKESTVVLIIVGGNIANCFYFIQRFTILSDIDISKDTYKSFDVRSRKFNGVELIFLSVDFFSLLRPEILNIARKSDIFILLADTAEELSEGLNILSKLESYNLFFVNSESKVIIEEHGYGISITGNSKLLSESQVKTIIINTYKYKGAKVYLSELSTFYALRAALKQGANIKPLVVISNSGLKMSNLADHFSASDIIPHVFTLDFSNTNWREIFLESILRKIGKIRVFTKSPSGYVDAEAILLKEDGTVGDLANFIHRDLIRSFKYAKVFRKSLGDWIKVGVTFKLMDGDIVEIRSR